MRQVSGFTLIELVAVIAILAILAVTALPKFLDLRDEARVAAAQGIAGAIASGTAVNYAKRLVTASGWSTVANCTDVGAVVSGGLPAGVTMAAGAVANGAAVTCTLTYVVNGSTAVATAVIVGAS